MTESLSEAIMAEDKLGERATIAYQRQRLSAGRRLVTALLDEYRAERHDLPNIEAHEIVAQAEDWLGGASPEVEEPLRALQDLVLRGAFAEARALAAKQRGAQ